MHAHSSHESRVDCPALAALAVYARVKTRNDTGATKAYSSAGVHQARHR